MTDDPRRGRGCWTPSGWPSWTPRNTEMRPSRAFSVVGSGGFITARMGAPMSAAASSGSSGAGSWNAPRPGAGHEGADLGGLGPRPVDVFGLAGPSGLRSTDRRTLSGERDLHRRKVHDAVGSEPSGLDSA